MVYDDLEFMLYRILERKLIFSFKNDIYTLESPSSYIRYYSQIIYHNIINDEKFNHWLRAENLDKILIYSGLWNKDSPTMIKQLEKQIEKAKIELFLSAQIPSKINKARLYLTTLRNNYDQLLSHKYEMHNHTLEGYANSIKNEYVFTNTLFKDNVKVFNVSQKNQTSYVFFNSLLNEVNKYAISIGKFKELARSDLWRSYWNCNKTNVFGESVKDWSDDQRMLCSLSIMYDNVYQHPDCPSDSIIQDDDMLDGWGLYQAEKIRKDKKQQHIDAMNPKLKNAQEVFIMADNTEDAAEIMDLNSAASLQKMKNRFATIDKSDAPVSDLAFDDVRLDILNKKNSK